MAPNITELVFLPSRINRARSVLIGSLIRQVIFLCLFLQYLRLTRGNHRCAERPFALSLLCSLRRWLWR